MAISIALATLGGGCFWCLEASFEQLKGVQEVVSGYAGSTYPNPTYDAVSSGKTGHAEVVQIQFDPTVISYEKLLNVFFTIHDPTTMDRQGHDVGSQYRSIILTHDESQKVAAQAAIAAINNSGKYQQPLVTQVQPLEHFYAAEDYHQNYFANNPSKSYCQLVVAPKVSKVKSTYAPLLKDIIE
jgi:peptide-methionine (S)-S-oxide reductase